MSKDGSVQVNLTTQPATQPAAQAGTTTGAQVNAAPTATTSTDAVRLEVKGEKDDDDKGEARLTIGKGHEKGKEHGRH